jgi:transposase InsO family protein
LVIPFDRLCDALGIEHRLTKVNHPWTNGQVERMNRTIREATVKRYYYQSHGHLKQRLHTFLMAYNLPRDIRGRRLRIMSRWCDRIDPRRGTLR